MRWGRSTEHEGAADGAAGDRIAGLEPEWVAAEGPDSPQRRFGLTPEAPVPDALRIGAATSKLVSAMIGDICLVMSRSPAHKHCSLADIEWMVLPAVAASQCYVAEAMDKDNGLRAPIAAVTWARVSDEVDLRLREQLATPIRLRPDEWTSGEHYWLVDLVGAPPGLSLALHWLRNNPFKDRTVHVVLHDDATGMRKVETLEALEALAIAAERAQTTKRAAP